MTMKPACLTIKHAVTFDRLEEFIHQEQERGAELTNGSDFERALALMTLRRFRLIRASRVKRTTSEGSEVEISRLRGGHDALPKEKCKGVVK
jgi:hypothetical protein